MKYFFLFFPVCLFIIGTSQIKAEAINISSTPKVLTYSTDFSQRITTFDLKSFIHSDDLQDPSNFPITTSFLSSLLNLLASDGYDTLLNNNDLLQSSIKEIQNSNGLNSSQFTDDNILGYLSSIDLTSINPVLSNLLEEKDRNNKNRKYLVLKLGVTDQLPSDLINQNAMVDYVTWPSNSGSNDLIEYYWFKKSKDSAVQGELWLVFSSSTVQASTSRTDEQTLLSNYSPSQQNSTVLSASKPSASPSKNQWWKSLTPEQHDAIIKTGVFAVGCVVACCFPEATLTEKAILLVCIPCFIELVETLSTACNALLTCC